MVSETVAITQDEIDAAKAEMLQRITNDPQALADLKTKNTAVITTMLPALLRAQVDEAAGDMGAAEWARRLIARELGYELPVKAGRSKVTKDARAEEIKAKGTRAAYADLLERVRSGALEL